MWFPGVVGLVTAVFSAVPDLVELVRYRLTVVEPAMAVSAATAGLPDGGAVGPADGGE